MVGTLDAFTADLRLPTQLRNRLPSTNPTALMATFNYILGVPSQPQSHLATTNPTALMATLNRILRVTPTSPNRLATANPTALMATVNTILGVSSPPRTPTPIQVTRKPTLLSPPHSTTVSTAQRTPTPLPPVIANAPPSISNDSQAGSAPPYFSFTDTVTLVVVIWLTALVGLLAFGFRLNKLTNETVSQRFLKGQFDLLPRDGAIRRWYTVTIMLLVGWGFLGAPVLIGLIGALFVELNPTISSADESLGVLLISMALGFILIRTILIALAAGVSSVFRAAATSKYDELSERKSLGLWELTKEVAAQIGVKPVNRIYIVAKPDLQIVRRGTLPDTLFNQTKFDLMLGLGGLDTLSQMQLKALVAAEHSFFSRQGNVIEAQLTQIITFTAGRLALNLNQRWNLQRFNPIVQLYFAFARQYYRIALTSQRFNRLLGDIEAAQHYGSNIYRSAMMQVLTNAIVFDTRIRKEIEQARLEKRLIHDIHALPVLEPMELIQLNQAINQIASQFTKDFDANFALRTRLDVVGKLPEKWFMSTDGEHYAIELIDHVELYHQRHTQDLQTLVNRMPSMPSQRPL